MKRILTLLLVLALAVAALASCDVIEKIPGLGDLIGGKECTEHVDADGDFVCDNCEAEIEKPHEHVFGENGSCSCGTLDPEYEALLDASAYVRQLYKDDAFYTPSTYELVSVVPVGNVTFNVVWTTDNSDIFINPHETDSTKVVVVLPELDPDKEVAYTLTATITSNSGYVATREFERALPQLLPMSFDEYIKAEDEAFVTVSGIVTGVFSKTTGSTVNGLYIQDLDNNGGYYVYNLEEDVNGKILPGMTVRVSGTKDIYNGTHEVISASVTVIDETIKTVTPVDYTEKLTNAKALDDADLVYAQALLVTVKGITIGGVGDNGYYYFYAGEHQVYLRISSSNNATTKEALETIKAIHAANEGNIADVTGVISLYSGKFYLSPVSAEAFNNVVETEKSDEEILELDLGKIDLPTNVSNDFEATLPLVGATEGTTFAWVSNNDCAVIGADGKLTITLPKEATVVTLTLTAKHGEATETKEYTINVAAKPNTVNVIVDSPVANGEYYFMLTHTNLGNKTLFITGEMDGYYYATSETLDGAVMIKVVDLGDGKYHLMVGEKYLNIIANGTYINVVFAETAPESHFTWNTNYKTFVINVNDTDYIYGTKASGTFTTISACKLSAADTTCIANLVVVKPDSDGKVELNADNLGLGNYAEGNATVEGFEFGFTELGCYGNGIQMRIKEGRVASLWNTVGFTYGIAKIELVFNSEKSTYDNTDAFAFYFGNDSEVSGCTVKLSTVAGQKVYTITPDKDTYTFFKMELLLSYTFYWDEINIVLTNAEEEPHTCVFEAATCTKPATCSCGATQGEALGHKINAETHLCTVCGADDPEYYWPMTIAEALAANKGKLVTISGKVVEIKEAWSSYNNMSVYIEDDNGKKIYVYRTKTQVNLGDVITVSGKVDEYNGVKQIGSGSTATVDVAHVCSEWDDATCTAPKTCKFCGKTEGEKLAHTYGEDGKCSCGAVKPVEGEVKATLAYAKCDTTANMKEGENAAATLGLDANLFTVIGTKCGNRNFPGLNKAGEIRMYASETDNGGAEGDGNEISVAIGGGKTIKSITITFTSADYAANCQISSGDNVIVTTDGTTTTVTVSINAASFVIKDVGTKQVRFSSIEITYA